MIIHILALSAALRALVPQTTNLPALEPGRPIERELAGGQSHTYVLNLEAGQYVRVVVTQDQTDVLLTLFGGNGKTLLELRSPGEWLALPIGILADRPEAFRLEVRPPEEDAISGSYRIAIEALRCATAEDAFRVVADTRFHEGERLLEQDTEESFRQADEKFDEMLSIWRSLGDRSGEAIALHRLGRARGGRGDRQGALAFYFQALSIEQEQSDRWNEAATLHDIGQTYYLLGEWTQSLEHQRQALALRRDLRDRRGEAESLGDVGAVYLSQGGELQKAIDIFSEVLALTRAIGARALQASALNNMAVAYTSMGDRGKALQLYEEALPLMRYEHTTGRNKSVGLSNIGLVYSLEGESQKALGMYNKALELSRGIGDHDGESWALTCIGALYLSLDQHRKALDYFGQALSLIRALGDRDAEAVVLGHIGKANTGLGEMQEALKANVEALALTRATGNKLEEAFALGRIGSLHDYAGEKQKALDHFNQALVLHRLIGDRRGEAHALNRIGTVYADLGETEKALVACLQALQLFRALGHRPQEVITLGNLARIERDRGNLAEAKKHIEAALSIAELLRTRIGSEDLRAAYLASVRGSYEFSIDLLMRLHSRDPEAGYAAEALAVSERARARSLLDLLTEARADIRQGVDPALLERERSVRKVLNAKHAEQMRLLGEPHTAEQADAVAKEIQVLTAQSQQVEGEIRVTSPRYASLDQPQPLALRDIQQTLDSDTLLLEYALGEERSFLWAVTRDDLTSYELPGRSVLEVATRKVYEAISARGQFGKTETDEQRRARLALAERTFPEAVAAVSEVLLSPVAAKLGKKRIVFVADGALQYLPFAALPVRAARGGLLPLAVEHEAVSLPSASVLAVLRRQLSARKAAPRVLAVLADPVFEKEDRRVAASRSRGKSSATPVVHSSTEQDSSLNLLRSAGDVGAAGEDKLRLPRLGFTRWEARKILALAPPEGRKAALDFEASRATATSSALAQYRFVHFATHGFLNSLHPELSGIVLSLVDQEGREVPGFLSTAEIFNLDLPVDMVVLSGCRTALGKEIRGEGLVGLTRGFMYAGAARVVASLWRVEDAATAELMRLFYEGILGPRHLAPAAALRAAQLTMLKQARWKSPYYWAAFQLQGEWN